MSELKGYRKTLPDCTSQGSLECRRISSACYHLQRDISVNTNRQAQNCGLAFRSAARLHNHVECLTGRCKNTWQRRLITPQLSRTVHTTVSGVASLDDHGTSSIDRMRSTSVAIKVATSYDDD